MTDFVYAIREEGGPVKIGKSMDVEFRMAVLQTSRDRSLRLVHKEPIPDTISALVVERHCHFTIRHREVENEWFTITDIGAVRAIRRSLKEALAQQDADNHLLFDTLPDDLIDGKITWTQDDVLEFMRSEADRTGVDALAKKIGLEPRVLRLYLTGEPKSSPHQRRPGVRVMEAIGIHQVLPPPEYHWTGKRKRRTS